MSRPRALPSRGSGRASSAGGLAQTFGAESSSRLRDIPLACIEPSPGQPRRRFDPVALDSLAASIRARGVLQPVLVRTGERSGFALIAGERRWRAAGLAGLTEIPAFVRDDTDDAAALELVTDGEHRA